MPNNLIIAGNSIPRGARAKLEIPVAMLFDYTQLSIPVEVLRGKQPGPIIFISAAIHGDEIIGVEIIKRLLERSELKQIRGTLIAVPIVNPFGYNSNIRYLPDRRDLNRCFPGSPDGSMAAQIANTFLNEIVKKCSFGIDIHSASIHRTNFPQIRITAGNNELLKLARCFTSSAVVYSPQRPGTLRKTAEDLGINMLLFEIGEALRYDETFINIGVKGIINVMKELKMLKKSSLIDRDSSQILIKTSYWIRAATSGSLRIFKKLGSFVETGELLGVISDPFGSRRSEVRALRPGFIIGVVTMPLINRGNALFHVGALEEMPIIVDKTIMYDHDMDIENEDWFNKK